MKASEFCYWLQGYFEITHQSGGPANLALTYQQTAMIERHLALVFKHDLDPKQGTPKHQAELQKIHDEDDESPAGPWPGGDILIRC
jgi:hypothetical protein